MALQKSGDWDDAGPQLAEASGGISGGSALRPGTITSQDDEYRWAGVEDPKVMITTSRDPSARLKKFVKVNTSQLNWPCSLNKKLFLNPSNPSNSPIN